MINTNEELRYWIIHKHFLNDTFECSVCHSETRQKTRHCPFCGKELIRTLDREPDVFELFKMEAEQKQQKETALPDWKDC